MRNWVLGGLAAGSLVMLLFYAGVIGLSGFFVPLVFMSVLTGGVPGALVGLTIGTVRRRDSVTRLPPHPQWPAPGAQRFPQPPPLMTPPLMTPPVAPPPARAASMDRWGAMVGRCELSVQRVAAAAATVPRSAGAEWLNRIVHQFAAELNDVRRIADLGRALEASAQDHPVSQRLAAAVKDFTAFEDEAGRVALKLVQQPDLASARVHLEMLEQQVPNLTLR
ncbi:hypothetical protein KCV87_22550 [Actinosynnema pretiosum subsp. pretiosum]|uniref:Uncharacterized protein n=1 Tax=Actinosynnema pretiosum subsp. pretiosum TaxID=103721 RepID=A0AA45L2W9_9PSEU|nr:hypothetical protein KCV87_22550 [Actinosynnema pretiosum subsp. pretiosum]